MKRLLLLLLLLVGCSTVSEKVFVANEESGSISVIDASSLKEIDRVSLTYDHDGSRIEFSPHNVQVAGDLVLVTANAPHVEKSEVSDNHESHGDHDMAEANAEVLTTKFPTGILSVYAHGDEVEVVEHADQLIVIDAKSHKILNRVDLDIGAHLAHVVSDGVFAYVTATDSGLLYKVNLDSGSVSFIALPVGSKPHGIRLTEDNKVAVIADMNKFLLFVDLSSKVVEGAELPGMGVQSGVVGDLALVSIFDTKQLGLYDMTNRVLSLVDLPDGVGPIQMFYSPDKKFVYVADQGVYFGAPEGRYTYKVDLDSKSVVGKIDTGFAPHGVVVSPDGRVWVSNLNGNSVSVIANDEKVGEIPVGAAPNGISFWAK